MDQWDDDLGGYDDDDKWDFGDSPDRDIPDPFISKSNVSASSFTIADKARAAPWKSVDQSELPSKPPDNAARKKRFEAAQQRAVRPCNVGRFAPEKSTTVIPAPLSKPVQEQKSRSTHVSSSHFPNHNKANDHMTYGRGRGSSHAPSERPGSSNVQPLSRSAMAASGIGRGIGRGRGRGYGGANNHSNAPSEVDTKFQAVGLNENVSDSQCPKVASSITQCDTNDNTQSNKRSTRDKAISLGCTQMPDAAKLEEIEKNNPGVSMSWMKKLLTEGSPGQSLPKSDRVPVGSVEIDKDWVARLEEKWTGPQRSCVDNVRRLLKECFQSVVNPYVSVLNILQHTKDFHTAKTSSLASCVVKEFNHWAKDDHLLHETCLNKQVKIDAFALGCRANMVYLDYIVPAYRLQHKDNDYFLPFIQSYLSKKKYKEAAHCVTQLGLQHCFDIKDICLPLILQDKVNMVENYICQRYDQQVALLKLLDQLVENNADMLHFVQEHSDVPKIKREKITRKILSKLAIRLMKLYEIPSKLCPNISSESALKALRYIMYKKYIENSLGPEQWVELVRDTVESNAYLQEQLIEQLVSYCDMEEAARWAKHYKLPEEQLPHQIKCFLPTAEPIDIFYEDSESTEDADADSENYHSLRLPITSVHWVDTREDFYRALDSITIPGSLVGIDAEWKPSFGVTLCSRISVLQLATDSDIYLFDILNFVESLDEEDWKHLAHSLFANSDVLKLGYGIEGDLRMLEKSLPCLSQPLREITRVVDLQDLHHMMFQACPDLFSNQAVEPSIDEESAETLKSEDNRGLAELVNLCLGKPLKKQQQLSDWEKRPLRQQQIMYAALDAFCLLEVYNHLIHKARELKLSVNLEPYISYKPHVKKSKAEKKHRWTDDAFSRSSKSCDNKNGKPMASATK